VRLGSLCTGYGGLDLAAEAHYGAETVWVCEYNPQASAVLDPHQQEVAA
jgi:DNA (cytosine-5)-methyltransferase 1